MDVCIGIYDGLAVANTFYFEDRAAPMFGTKRVEIVLPRARTTAWWTRGRYAVGAIVEVCLISVKGLVEWRFFRRN